MVYELVFAPPAQEDLKSNFVYVADASGIETATEYDAKIRAACLSLTRFPNRGTPRDDIRPGLRSIPLGGAVTIFYEVAPDEVRIVRVIHARRDLAAAFEDSRESP